MTEDDVWVIYINSYIVDLNDRVWAGPNAIDLPIEPPIHILTACNPFDRKLSEQENTKRNQSLHLKLKNLEVDITDVIGRSANYNWQEPSFAVTGLRRSQACHMANEFQQRAIFEIDHQELCVICVSDKQIKQRRSRLITFAN